MNVQPDSKYVQELMGDPDSLAKLLESHGTLSVYVLARQLGDVRTTLTERERDIARLKLQIQGMQEEHQKLLDLLKKRFAEVRQSVDELRVAKV